MSIISDTIVVQDASCVKNATVYGLASSIKRAKYPLSVDTSQIDNSLTPGIRSLAQSERASGHDQWLTGVVVQFDLTFSCKAWVEAERYHFLDFVSSQSTMHRITSFDLNLSYNEYVDPRIVEIMKEKVACYNENNKSYQLSLFDRSPEEESRVQELSKQAYLEILYSNPAGFMLTAGMTTNYRQLKTIYAQRKTHRLPEWREFCRWIETLPHSELIVGGKECE